METKTKKHIDVVVKYFYPVTAGIETNILETYSVLAEKGWDITIHTSKNTALEKDILSDTDKIRGLKIKRYHFGPFGFNPDINWQTTDLVCLHNFDIFPHFQLMLRILWLKITGRKNFGLTITPHGGFNPEWSVFPFTQRIIKFIYNYSLGALLINLSADGVRAVSEWEKEEMIKHGLKRKIVAVISNGVEDEAFANIENLASSKIKKEVESLGRYIIQIGRIYPIKNYETTIKSLPHLPKDINYVIAGPVSDEKYHQKLIKLAESLNVKNRVHFIGIIRGVDKYYLIKHARVMVHMALWESFCNVLHEALSQGVVCVAADNTAIPYIIKDKKNGFLVPTKDSQKLADKLNYVIKNYHSSEINKIRAKNIEVGRKWSWRNVAEKMDEFYISKIKKHDHISQNNNQIEKIISEKIPCIFVSPHLDDAALSAGDLLFYLSKNTKVEIINVFTSSSEKPYTLSTKAFLYKCGYSDANDLFTDRIKEDEQALSKLRIKPINLGFIDAPFRKYKNVSRVKLMFSKLLPELIHTYPVHRWHISDGVISYHDTRLLNQIASELKQITSKYKNYYIFCPIADGTHVDHKIVRKVCEANFKNVIFWSDYPYETGNIKDKSVKMAFSWRKNSSQKIGLISGYKSQINMLFPDQKIKIIPEIYYVKN